jgi:hypothetical protein
LHLSTLISWVKCTVLVDKYTDREDTERDIVY